MLDSELISKIDEITTQTSLDCIGLFEARGLSVVEIAMAWHPETADLYVLAYVPEGPIVMVSPISERAQQYMHDRFGETDEGGVEGLESWANSVHWQIFARRRLQHLGAHADVEYRD